MSEEDQVNSGYVDTAVDGLPEELGADNTADERPEWLPQKFKTGEDLAKSYGELEKKIGAYTGAPEAYDNDFLGDVSVNEDTLSDFQEMARSHNINQETYQELVGYHNSTVQDIVDYYTSPETEMNKLGDNAAQRVSDAAGFLEANLSPEDYKVAEDALTTAGAVEIVEMMIKATKPKKLPFEGGDNPQGITVDKLTQMRNAKDESGGFKMNDPTYRAEYEKLERDFYGNKSSVKVLNNVR